MMLVLDEPRSTCAPDLIVSNGQTSQAPNQPAAAVAIRRPGPNELLDIGASSRNHELVHQPLVFTTMKIANGCQHDNSCI